MNNSFVKFIIKISVLFVLLFIFDRSVGLLFVKMKDIALVKNPENIWVKTPYVVEKVESDIIIIGSSKASHHYVPQMIEDSLGMSVYNCGQDGCFFLYQNCIVNMILDRYNPKMIIWDIQPQCFNDAEDMAEYQNIRYLSPYYGNNHWATSYINSESDSSRFKMRSRMFAYNSKLLNYVYPLLVNSKQNNKGYIPLQISEYEYPQIDTSKVYSKYIQSRTKLENLYQTLDRSRKLGVPLKIMISPEFNKVDSALNSAISDIEAIAEKTEVSFNNFMSVFSKSSYLFKDASHLNDAGAKAYTKNIISVIN